MKTWLVAGLIWGCSAQTFGTAAEEDAGGDVVVDQGAEEVQEAEAADAISESCIPFTCEELGYQCGTENSDGCGGVLVCGPPYKRHSDEDWPATDEEGHGCVEQRPYSWACGGFGFPGGDPPFSSCVPWPGSATWCCTESA